jgi:L-rhamnose isomerase
LNDELKAICEEIGRCRAYDRVHLALDFFDASINRIAAWAIGSRATLKGLLLSLLEPTELLQELERSGDLSVRLAMMEELKSLPFGSVWDHFCLHHGVPAGWNWLQIVQEYENSTLSKRK